MPRKHLHSWVLIINFAQEKLLLKNFEIFRAQYFNSGLKVVALAKNLVDAKSQGSFGGE